MRDFHIHSNYSDGDFLGGMVHAAEAADLEAVGLADHCNVAPRDHPERMRGLYGFNLDITYDRRRRALERLRERRSIAIYDAVEMDYDPRDEEAIGDFLADADFDYAIGSVHEVDNKNVQVAKRFTDLSDDARDAVVDEYFDRLVSLIESELFDVAAHVDLIERTRPLRGRATTDHYRRVARALADSRTIPEINAGRALTDEGIVHPVDEFLDVLREHDVAVTVGTDAHAPDEIEPRAEFLEDFFARKELESAAPPSLE